MPNELPSLRRQLADTDSSLRLIQERKTAYVYSTDIPLQLLKEEQVLQARRDTLAARIAALEQAQAAQPTPHRREDWGEAPDVDDFHGRTAELTTLTQWITTDRCRLVTILGIGGMGKTTLATHLAQQVAAPFACIFWRSLRNAPPLTDLLGQCIGFLSHQQQTDLPDDAPGRIRLLLDYLRQQRCLLVLDNVETILQGGQAAGAYRAGYAGYGDLFQRVGEARHESLLLLTSREKPQGLAQLEGKRVRTLELAGVSTREGQAILHEQGLAGSDPAWAELVHIYSGNPLALKLTADSIRTLFAGRIEPFLQHGETILRDVRAVLDEQFNRLTPLEQELLYWLAIEREPVSADALHATLLAPVSLREVLEALHDLRRRSLVEQSPAGLTLQNVVLEYLTERLVEQVVEEIETGRIGLLNSHALMKAQAKEYVRNSQVRLILDEVLEQLTQRLGSREAVVAQLTEVLALLREEAQAQ